MSLKTLQIETPQEKRMVTKVVIFRRIEEHMFVKEDIDFVTYEICEITKVLVEHTKLNHLKFKTMCSTNMMPRQAT